MPGSPGQRVFISYARIDGAELAQRLQGDLRNKGYDAWLDTQRIRGGSTWSKEIETALDEADFVLALLTPGSYASEICRAEQLRSLRKGKCVIPLKAQRGTEIPLHLETKNYRDFTADNTYTEAFRQLLEDIYARSGILLKEAFRQTYVTAPPLPMNYVVRPEALRALRDTLITDGSGRHIALTALEGMGGIGKTVLAKALCHDEVVQQAFPDGVIWITVGKESAFDVVTRLREVGKALKDDLDRYDNELGCKNQYRSTIRNKAALIVIDDVWKASDVEPLLAESVRSRLLFTTRDANIAAAVGAREHVADLLTFGQSREVLARWSGIETAQLPPLADDLIQECGRLPLALSMVGAMLRGKPSTMWQRIHDLLRNADLGKISAQFPDYPYPSLLAAIQVSINELDATTRERYVALAVLIEDMSASPAIQRCLWKVDEYEAAEIAGRLVNLSLAQRDGTDGGIRLHDLQLDYVRTQYPDRGVLDVIHEAVRLSSGVIAKDSFQFTPQVVGRLLCYASEPAVRRFVTDVSESAPCPWLRPLWPSLDSPAGEFVRTLTGHSEAVTAVAVSADGRLAVSASHYYDETLKVWELDSGRELRTLKGHSGPVTGVAVSADGRLAVSASWDKTVKVWELDSGRELRTLSGHTSLVTAVAVTPDGKLAVSGAYRELKVWELDSGRELRTLEHRYGVNGVAVSADGRRAVSACSEGSVRVWELDSGREPCTLTGHNGEVHGVAVSADGRLAVSASADVRLKVWELDSGRELCALTGHSDEVHGVAVSADGRLAVSASADKTLKVWDLGSGRELRTLKGHSGRVHGVAVSADGRRAVSTSWDHTLKVWELGSGREPSTLTRHKSEVHGVAVSADERLVVSASGDHTLKVWDMASGRELHTLTGHSDRVTGVAVSADGRRAVSASEDHTLKVWELDGGRELRTLTGHSDWVSCVAVSAGGRLLVVSASRDHTLKVWELDSGRELRTLTGHSSDVFRVTVTPDGRRAVSTSADGTLKVWDVGSGRELRTFTGHSSSAHGVAVDPVGVSPDGRRAVSASKDETLKVSDLDSGEALATFICDSNVTCCSFVNSRRVIAGDELGRLYLLQLEMPA
jgi:WD40 repeat protein